MKARLSGVLVVVVYVAIYICGEASGTRRLVGTQVTNCAISGTCPPPTWQPTWNLTQSTVIQPGGGSHTGYFMPPANQHWGLVSLDWSNAIDIWSKPGRNYSTCEATSIKNCQMLKAAGRVTRCYIYHNTELALQWLESQRAVMYDPSKKDWFCQYMTPDGKKNGTIYNSPVGVGDQYFWDYTNPAAAQYFIDSIVRVVSAPGVDGTFTDDIQGIPEEHPNFQAHTRMSDAQIVLQQAATSNMVERLMQALVKAGKYDWQAFGNEDSLQNGPSSTSCTLWMREYCAASRQNMVLGMSMDSSAANQNQTVAAFLIVRPPHAWLGWGWESDETNWNPIFLLDVGQPTGLCQERATGVFSRQWTKGTAVLNCNSWAASLPFSPY